MLKPEIIDLFCACFCIFQLNLFGPYIKNLEISINLIYFINVMCFPVTAPLCVYQTLSLNLFPVISHQHARNTSILSFCRTPCCFSNVVLTANYLSQPRAHSLGCFSTSCCYIVKSFFFSMKSLETLYMCVCVCVVQQHLIFLHLSCQTDFFPPVYFHIHIYSFMYI